MCSIASFGSFRALESPLTCRYDGWFTYYDTIHQKTAILNLEVPDMIKYPSFPSPNGSEVPLNLLVAPCGDENNCGGKVIFFAKSSTSLFYVFAKLSGDKIDVGSEWTLYEPGKVCIGVTIIRNKSEADTLQSGYLRMLIHFIDSVRVVEFNFEKDPQTLFQVLSAVGPSRLRRIKTSSAVAIMKEENQLRILYSFSYGDCLYSVIIGGDDETFFHTERFSSDIRSISLIHYANNRYTYSLTLDEPVVNLSSVIDSAISSRSHVNDVVEAMKLMRNMPSNVKEHRINEEISKPEKDLELTPPNLLDGLLHINKRERDFSNVVLNLNSSAIHSSISSLNTVTSVPSLEKKTPEHSRFVLLTLTINENIHNFSARKIFAPLLLSNDEKGVIFPLIASTEITKQVDDLNNSQLIVAIGRSHPSSLSGCHKSAYIFKVTISHSHSGINVVPLESMPYIDLKPSNKNNSPQGGTNESKSVFVSPGILHLSFYIPEVLSEAGELNGLLGLLISQPTLSCHDENIDSTERNKEKKRWDVGCLTIPFSANTAKSARDHTMEVAERVESTPPRRELQGTAKIIPGNGMNRKAILMRAKARALKAYALSEAAIALEDAASVEGFCASDPELNRIISEINDIVGQIHRAE